MSAFEPWGDTRTETRFSWYAALGAGVWLLFLAPAVQDAWAERGALVGWLGLVDILAFSALYVWSFIWARTRRHSGEIWRRVLPGSVAVLGLLIALGAGMVLTVHSAGLGSAVYVAVAAVTLLPWWVSLPVAAVLGALAETLARTVPGWQGAAGIALSVGLAVFAVLSIWTAMRRSRDLVAAKEENARLVIGQERARLARDLHDILGHSLTVIAVKAELADRLVDVSPDRARAEIVDIQRLSRDALRDVRLTVDGVRDLTLPGEISRARAALAAAQVAAELPGSTDDVPTELRELFAWTLREGVTNVVRHSAARSCTVRLGADRIDIVDDGRGMPAAGEQRRSGSPDGSALPDGHGLSGLRERAAAAGARVVVEAPATGGFHLAVVRATGPAAATPPTTRGGSALDPQRTLGPAVPVR
jgi:two-component system sensor histidine kinase DesK